MKGRREFFKIATTAGLASHVLSSARQSMAGSLPTPSADGKRFLGGTFPRSPVMAKGRVLGANDRILVGHIGLGGMGSTHLGHFKKLAGARNTESIALCDVYSVRLEKRKASLAEGPGERHQLQADKDYRRILENKDVDAVVIATPEHWHCQIALHALEAGKHVYVEKPLARYLDEAFQVYDAQKRTGKVVQVGAHYCADPKYQVAREALASGKLGQLVSVQTSYARNSKGGEWNYSIDPEAGPDNLDWEMWLGSAPKRPWSDDAKTRFFRYRKYRDYSAGILGDLMPHFIHPIIMTVGAKDWPTKVTCVGTRAVSTDREVSDTVHVLAEMQGGWTLLYLSSTVNEQGVSEMIRGHKASLYLAGKTPELRPERPYAEEIEGGPLPVVDPGESHTKHQSDWLQGIRDNRQPKCNLEVAIRTQVIVALAEMSEVMGKTMLFDPATRRWRAG